MDVSQSETTVQELVSNKLHCLSRDPDRSQFKILAEKCELGSLDELELDVGIF